MKLYYAAAFDTPLEGSEMQSEPETLGIVSFVDERTGKGTIVHLDTGECLYIFICYANTLLTLVWLAQGAAITDLPAAAVTAIRSAIFKTRVADESSRFHFNIPDSYRLGRKILIDFEFRGEGKSSVTVTGPAVPFLWQETNGLFPDLDGGALIFPDRPPYTLGVVSVSQVAGYA